MTKSNGPRTDPNLKKFEYSFELFKFYLNLIAKDSQVSDGVSGKSISKVF